MAGFLSRFRDPRTLIVIAVVGLVAGILVRLDLKQRALFDLGCDEWPTTWHEVPFLPDNRGLIRFLAFTPDALVGLEAFELYPQTITLEHDAFLTPLDPHLFVMHADGTMVRGLELPDPEVIDPDRVCARIDQLGERRVVELFTADSLGGSTASARFDFDTLESIEKRAIRVTGPAPDWEGAGPRADGLPLFWGHQNTAEGPLERITLTPDYGTPSASVVRREESRGAVKGIATRLEDGRLWVRGEHQHLLDGATGAVLQSAPNPAKLEWVYGDAPQPARATPLPRGELDMSVGWTHGLSNLALRLEGSSVPNPSPPSRQAVWLLQVLEPLLALLRTPDAEAPAEWWGFPMAVQGLVLTPPQSSAASPRLLQGNATFLTDVSVDYGGDIDVFPLANGEFMLVQSVFSDNTAAFDGRGQLRFGLLGPESVAVEWLGWIALPPLPTPDNYMPLTITIGVSDGLWYVFAGYTPIIHAYPPRYFAWTVIPAPAIEGAPVWGEWRPID